MSSVFHGGRLDVAIAEFGGSQEDWLDLSTGINPNAYPIPEIASTLWQRLPDETAQAQLIKAAKCYYQVPENMDIVAGNGTQALIQNLPQILKHKTVAIVSPTYEEHRHCWEKAGRSVVKSETLKAAVEVGDIVVVVNPNNPTGRTYQPNELLKVAKTLASKSGFLIVDEAFGDCILELSIIPSMVDNVIVLRSFGKFFGLAGLRLGFAICSKTHSEKLWAKQGPWNVSGPALTIGSQALVDNIWITKTRVEIKQNSEAQAEVIEVCGLKLIGNAGLFMEFEHKEASNLYAVLQHEHILIRPFPERPTRVRFGLCKNMEELERLALVLKKHA